MMELSKQFLIEVKKLASYNNMRWVFEKLEHIIDKIIQKKSINLSNILIATHTFDIYGKQISKYDFSKIRFIHIDGKNSVNFKKCEKSIIPTTPSSFTRRGDLI